MIFIIITGMAGFAAFIDRQQEPPMTAIMICTNILMGWALPGYSFIIHPNFRHFLWAKRRIHAVETV